MTPTCLATLAHYKGADPAPGWRHGVFVRLDVCGIEYMANVYATNVAFVVVFQEVSDADPR